VSVLALVTKLEEVGPVVTWAIEFARSRETTLSVLCWAHSPAIHFPLLSGDGEATATDDLVDAVHRLAKQTLDGKDAQRLPSDKITVRRSLHPSAVTATLERIRLDNHELVVAAAPDQTGCTGATYATNPLLRESPCNTVILFGGSERSARRRRVFVAVNDNVHDVAAVFLASRMAEKCESKVTVARAEKDYEEEAIEVGRRELQQLMRDAGVNRNDRIQRQVYHSGSVDEIAAAMEKQDLVLLGANNQQAVQTIVELTKNPSVAVMKRSPPLRPWRRGKRGVDWNPRLSAADYADLIQGLRGGSRLSVDFLTMLGLAAAIASLGLLQDSPAVVIGSMLLAPLMTPMLGAGLALAQANPKLGNSAIRSISFGLLFTLLISFLTGLVTPGEELTSQILARGNPNLLDLAIAVFSAAAAAYALARPNLVGAIAGVAIATALVPPLCSVGVSIAYRDFPNAYGATILFATNLVAIILGAALTFRFLGVTSSRAERKQRRWVYRTVATLCIAVVVLAIPLERALNRSIDQGKPQPSTYPLTLAVTEALVEYVATLPDVRIVAAGRPSSAHALSDVVVFLTSPRLMPRSYAKKIVAIVRREMGDQELIVNVVGLKNEWEQPKDAGN